MKSRTEQALEVAIAALKSHSSYLGNCALTEIDAILHPVEAEEVPVVKWWYVGMDCEESSHKWAEDLSQDDRNSRGLVKLTGTIRREKKVVERSVRDGTVRDVGILPGRIVIDLPAGYIMSELPGLGKRVAIEWTE